MVIRCSLGSLICQTPVKRCAIGVLSALVFTSCQIQKINIQLLMKENTVSTVTNRLVVIFRIIVILLTCIILHFRTSSMSEVKLFMEHNGRGKTYFPLVLYSNNKKKKRRSTFALFLSFIPRSHRETVRFWSRAAGSQALVQMLIDNHFNGSSVVSSKLLLCS